MNRATISNLTGAKLMAGLLIAVLFLLVGCRGDSGPDEPVWSSTAVHLSGVSCGTPEAGMGAIIGDDLILTSGHVVLAMQQLDVLLADGTSVEGEVIHIDRTRDVALVRAPVRGSFTPEIRDAAVDEAGVIALLDKEAALEDQAFTVTGRITARTENVGRSEMVQRPSLELLADIQRGDSGAALWVGDARNPAIVGVIWAVSTTDDRVFAVQGDEVAAVVRDGLELASGPGDCERALL